MQQSPNDAELRVALIASAVVDELSKRYSVSPQDIVEAVAWVREHRAFVAKLKHSGYLTVIGTLVGAGMLVAWEGIKATFRKGGV